VKSRKTPQNQIKKTPVYSKPLRVLEVRKVPALGRMYTIAITVISLQSIRSYSTGVFLTRELWA
jgi:hypothetical protein